MWLFIPVMREIKKYFQYVVNFKPYSCKLKNFALGLMPI